MNKDVQLRKRVDVARDQSSSWLNSIDNEILRSDLCSPNQASRNQDSSIQGSVTAQTLAYK